MLTVRIHTFSAANQYLNKHIEKFVVKTKAKKTVNKFFYLFLAILALKYLRRTEESVHSIRAIVV